jgi:glycosyltransferase involved in cell wall biosynthesis
VLDRREREDRVEGPVFELERAGVHLPNLEPVLPIRVWSERTRIVQHQVVGFSIGEVSLAVDVGCHDAANVVGQPIEHLFVPCAHGEDRGLVAELRDVFEKERERCVLPVLPMQIGGGVKTGNDLVDPRAQVAVFEVGEVAELDVLTPKPTFSINIVGRDERACGVLGHSGPKYAQRLGAYGWPVPPPSSVGDALSIGLNLTFLVEESGGAGRYARELVRAILEVEPDTRITAFVGATAPSRPFDSDLTDRVELVRFPVPGTGLPPWHLLAQMGALPVMAARRKLDIVHGLANLIPPVSPAVPTVVTLLDVTWAHFPKTLHRTATLARKVLVPPCARAADRVIAISDAARRDIVETLDLDPGKVDVTPLGVRRNDEPQERVSADEIRRRFEIGAGPVVLCVAQKREHKNLARLIRAVAALDDGDVQLVLAGESTPHESDLRTIAVELGVGERAHFLPWISDAELEGLYELASCFVLPSFMEGFGLPVLEAMQHGVPVACSDVSSLPEAAGDAALYFDPSSVEEIGRAIERLIRDRRLADDLVRRGYERCAAFTWAETARRTLATYRRAIEGSRRARRDYATAARERV